MIDAETAPYMGGWMENDTLKSGSSENPPFNFDSVIPGLFQGEFPEAQVTHGVPRGAVS